MDFSNEVLNKNSYRFFNTCDYSSSRSPIRTVIEFLVSPGGGGGDTRPLPRDGGVEELHKNPTLTVGPHPMVWTRD